MEVRVVEAPVAATSVAVRALMGLRGRRCEGEGEGEGEDEDGIEGG